MGLAIADAIARAHGGRCSVEPRPVGTVFAMHLPVRPRHADAAAAPPVSVEETPGAAAATVLS